MALEAAPYGYILNKQQGFERICRPRRRLSDNFQAIPGRLGL